MKIYIDIIKALYKKIIKREKTGKVIKDFCESKGVVYIKLAQILSTQNIGNKFKEEDRLILVDLCDDCKKLPYSQIENILKDEYNCDLKEIFSYIDPISVGAASISQVHKAVLKNGDVVAVKIKRKDITDNIDKDIEDIKKLALRHGRLIGLKNKIASIRVLDLYLKWIYQETDFVNEKENIIKYSNFAKSVNNNVEDTKLIKVPKVYNELCTENIIVMEYIEDKTLKNLPLTEENKERISIALNSYIKNSFYALFKKKTVIFHGDPHNGNIYLDKYGNIGFLDMGNIFELSEEDAKLCLNCFLAGYTKDYNYLYNFLKNSGDIKKRQLEQLKTEVIDYCNKIHERPLTNMFTDLMFICLNYNICPPDFLFGMAKVFTCLNGINGISLNKVNTKELLSEQVMEFYINKTLKSCKGLLLDSLYLSPKLLKSSLKYGLVKGIVNKKDDLFNVALKAEKTFQNLNDMFNLMHNELVESNNESYSRKYKR